MATVAGLFVSPGRGSGRSESRERVLAIESQGLEGCAHGNPPRREVLLVSKEHLDAVGVEPGAIRENVTVEGTDVHSWPVGQRVKVGGALLEITMVCEPCHRMDELGVPWARSGAAPGDEAHVLLVLERPQVEPSVELLDVEAHLVEETQPLPRGEPVEAEGRRDPSRADGE